MTDTSKPNAAAATAVQRAERKVRWIFNIGPACLVYGISRVSMTAAWITADLILILVGGVNIHEIQKVKDKLKTTNGARS